MTPRATSLSNLNKLTTARRVMPRKAEEAMEDYLEMIDLLVAEMGSLQHRR